MAISSHYGLQAQGGGQPQWSLDEVQMAVAEQIQKFNRKLSDGGPQFGLERELDSSLDIQMNGYSVLIIVPDDGAPGEFLLLKPYAVKEFPLGGGVPDQKFFGEVRDIMKEAVRGELMTDIDFDSDDPPANTAGPQAPPDDDGPSDDEIDRLLRSLGLN